MFANIMTIVTVVTGLVGVVAPMLTHAPAWAQSLAAGSAAAAGLLRRYGFQDPKAS